MKIIAIVAVTWLAQGCFWPSTPPGRPQSIPDIVPGEDMKYESSSYQTGVDGDGATYNSYASAKYRGRELTQNEFSMLVDPEFPAKAKQYDSLRSACLRGNILKYPAVFAAIAGVVAYPSLDGRTDRTTQILVSGGLVAGGAVLGALSYFLGGNRCTEANELSATIGAERFDDTNVLGTSAGETEVEKFNERYGIKKPPTDAPPADEPPADAPPADDPPASE